MSTCTTHSHRVNCKVYSVTFRSETLMGGRVHLHHPLSQSVLYSVLYSVTFRSEMLTGGRLHHPLLQSVLYRELCDLKV